MYQESREVEIRQDLDSVLTTCPALAVSKLQLVRILGVGLPAFEEAEREGRLLAPISGFDVWSIDEVRDWLRHGAPPCDDWEGIKAQRQPATPDRSSDEGGQHGT